MVSPYSRYHRGPAEVPTIPTLPQLEDGEIYLLGHTFRYFYGIDGKLWLRASDVSQYFHVLTREYTCGVPPELLRRVVTRVCVSPMYTGGRHICKVFVVGEPGVRNLNNRARQNKRDRMTVLKLFKTYRKDKRK